MALELVPPSASKDFKRNPLSTLITILLIVLAVAAAYYFGIFKANRQFESSYFALWSKVQSANIEVRKTICKENVSLSEIGRFTDQALLPFSGYERELQLMPCPKKYRTLHLESLGAFQANAAFLKSITDAVNDWRHAEASLANAKEQARTAAEKFQNIENSWPNTDQLQPKLKDSPFTHELGIFEQTINRAKAKTTAATLANSEVAQNDEAASGYLGQMRSLLRRYQHSRGGLSRYLDDNGWPKPGFSEHAPAAISEREVILAGIESLDPPQGQEGFRNLAVQMVRDGIDAVRFTQNGDFVNAHRISQQNTARLNALKKEYGLR